MSAQTPSTDSAPGGLRRALGLPEATTLVAGGIVGASIFLLPAAVADIAGGPWLALTIWGIAGLVAACSALSFAELGAAIPQTGGAYVHLKRAFRSHFLGFSYGWMMLFGYGSAALAVVSIMASGYLSGLITAAGFEPPPERAMAIAMILTVAGLNTIGVKASGRAQIVLTATKFGLLILLVAVPLLTIGGDPAALSHPGPERTPGELIGVITDGLLLCFFSFSGAYFVTQVAGELRNPQRDIPRAIALGFGAVLILYLLFNLVCILVLPFDQLRNSDRIAADVMRQAVGEPGAILVAIAIIISALGVLNAQLLSYPRVVFALAQDGLLPSFVAKVHERSRTPYLAVIAVTICACLYAASGSYRNILSAVGFVSHLFTVLAVVGLMVLRFREPDLPRPYRVRPYPWAPLVFIAISAIYLGNLLVTRFEQSMIGLLIVAVGAPVYFFRRSKIPRSIEAEAAQAAAAPAAD
ncbi:APC family permease [Phenylobacterium sp.]|jgi:APA family basic amino acid/polyamine antiporter|uniref:APC family permease n=1 Tax=Phenylobacterium sp. TaxID=1871053 RepID=UPI003782EE3D